MKHTNRTLVKDLDLKPGDILLLRIEGFVGWMVDMMQRINKDTSYWTHAAIVLDDLTVFEAQPGGSRITRLAEYADRPGAVVRYYQRPKVHNSREYVITPFAEFMNGSRRASIVRDAREMHKRGYEYAYSTYFYLALVRFGIDTNWVKWHVQNSERGICSQACDLLYADNAVHLFADGRMPYDVTPGDLGSLALP